MDALFPTLFAKTFFMLGAQLSVTWLSAHLTLAKFRQLHNRKVAWITSSLNNHGEVDMHVKWHEVKFYFYGLLIADILVFLVLLFWGAQQSLGIAFALFSIWSILTGIDMALALISVDENLGGKVLGITATVVFGTSLVGIYSGIDFGFLGKFLFIALLGLIAFNLVRLFVAIPRATQRWVAGIGVVVFTLYLVHDFNRLAKMQEMGLNDWNHAVRISISLYLDVINLFLELLDMMSG